MTDDNIIARYINTPKKIAIDNPACSTEQTWEVRWPNIRWVSFDLSPDGVITEGLSKTSIMLVPGIIPEGV
jgi:hypothetical protein